jgi:putative membrane protein
MSYLVFKSLHFIALVAWFAGLFYMFRLFVYHTENGDKFEVTQVLKVMERRLYKIITVPAMVATFVFGFGTAFAVPGTMGQPWFHVKLLMVLLLAGYTGFIGYTRKRYERDDLFLSSKQCRLLNEVPTLLLVLIVFWMVILRRYLG